MEVGRSNTASGSLHISSDVIEKISRLAALEVEGVADVTLGTTGVTPWINKIAPKSAITVEMKDDVAYVTVHISVKYGSSVPELSKKVQQNVKQSVQNMTQITVAKVNVVIMGIAADDVHVETEAENE